jgi:hypothetical protein
MISSIVAWRLTADAIMKAQHSISLCDAGISEADIARHFKREPDARRFVEWFAMKYDLGSVSEVGWPYFHRDGARK